MSEYTQSFCVVFYMHLFYKVIIMKLFLPARCQHINNIIRCNSLLNYCKQLLIIQSTFLFICPEYKTLKYKNWIATLATARDVSMTRIQGFSCTMLGRNCANEKKMDSNIFFESLWKRHIYKIILKISFSEDQEWMEEKEWIEKMRSREQ